MKFSTWPDSDAYREAIVDSQAIGDLEVVRLSLERLPSGLPKTYEGTFATTFHLEAAGGGFAYRCFTRGNDDLERRYFEIAKLLRDVHDAALCRTQYLAYGIRAAGTWWPAVKMEWVCGRTLDDEIENRLGDGEAILALAASFRRTVRSLGDLEIAHGDLQHANILVAEGRLRLIDYDAMFVPALAGLEQSEYGHCNYQHPGRRAAPFDGRLDRFSSIVIYTSLTALAAEPSLWRRFHDEDNLLFRAHDFTSGGSSELWRALLGNNATSGLAETLALASQMPFEEVPTLEDAIKAASGSASALSAFPPPIAPRSEPRDATVPAARRSPLPHRASSSRPVPEPEAAPPRRLMPLLASSAMVAGLAVLAATTIIDWPQGTSRQRASGQPMVLGVAPPPGQIDRNRRKPSWKPAAAPIVAALPRATLAPAAAASMLATTKPIAPTTARAAAPRAIVAAAPARSVSVVPATPQTTLMPAATIAPRRVAPPTAIAALRARALSPATVVPLARPTPATATPAATADYAVLRGAWRINEANVQVGRMIWHADAALSESGTIVLLAHKESVAGEAATPCERQTNLHASFALGVAPQTVRYQEVNCAGSAASGEVRVVRFSPDHRSFRGTFWQRGAKLGDFDARKL